LLRTFADITSEEYESCSKPNVYKKLAFATAFFNANILERRKFGAVGWNIQYEWMKSDLKAAMTQVKMYVEEQTQIPWETLKVSVADITYGGRVTDVWDKRTNACILRKFFDPNLMVRKTHCHCYKTHSAHLHTDLYFSHTHTYIHTHT